MPTPGTLYVWALVVACSAGLTVGAVGWQYRSVPGGSWFVAHMVVIAAWSLSAAVGLLTTEAGVRLAFEGAHVVLGSIAVLTWFGFVLSYTGRGDLFAARVVGALLVLPAAMAAAAVVPPARPLVWSSWDLVRVAGVTTVVFESGPLLLVTGGILALLFFVGLALLVERLVTADRLFTGQTAALIVGTIPGVAAAGIALVGLVPWRGLNVMPIAQALVGVAYGYALFYYRLFELVPATRQIGEAAAIDDLEEGLIVTNVEGTVLTVNESVVDAFDRTESSILGRPVDQLLGDVEESALSADPVDVEHAGRVYEVSRSSIQDRLGRLIGFSYLLREVTEQRERKQRLEVLNRVLRHNVRNDMNVVSGYATLLSEDLEGPAAEKAEHIRETAGALAATSKKATAIERALSDGRPAPELVAVAELLDGVLERLREQYPATAIEVTVPDGAAVVTDRRLLELVVANVLENAFEHSSPQASPGTGGAALGDSRSDDAEAGGAAGSSVDSPGVSVAVEEQADGLTVVVTDDGPGIHEGELAAIEAGAETELRHSSGLGLWVVNWAVASIDGEVDFERSEEGTTVTLRVPSLSA